MRQQGGSQIQSRNGNAAARARSTSRARRPSWYRRALGGLLMWNQPTGMGAPPARARAARGRPLWLSSLKAAASALAHVACLCEPVCARDGPLGVQVDAVAPRRTSRSDGRSPQAPVPPAMLAGEWAEEWSFSTFRGRSLNEDLLMRRFVLAEEATRRRVQMEVAAKRYGRWWLPPGPSRLSEMSLADDDVAEDEAAESGSSSP